jgi:hypothetical protein
VGFLSGLLGSFDSCIWKLFLISWCEEVLSPFVFTKWVRDDEVPTPHLPKNDFGAFRFHFLFLSHLVFFPLVHTKKCMCVFFCSIQEYPIEDHSLFVCLLFVGGVGLGAHLLLALQALAIGI